MIQKITIMNGKPVTNVTVGSMNKKKNHRTRKKNGKEFGGDINGKSV
jgi:hypothetical protein